MYFNVVATDELTHCDFPAILQFQDNELAKKAADAINQSVMANAPGIVSEGNTGAMKIGNYVAFNSYSEQCYNKILKLVEQL